METAADDLDHVVAFLEEAATSSASSNLSTEDTALIEAVAEWIGHLSWMAVAMSRQVELAPPPEESPE